MNRLQFGPLALIDARPHPGEAASGRPETETIDSETLETSAAFDLRPDKPSNAAVDLQSNAKTSYTGGLSTGGLTHGQRLFIPAGYEKNYAYPLVVYLHDSGHDASFVQQFMPEVSVQNYVGSAFTSPRYRQGCLAWLQDESTIADSLEGLASCIRHAQRRTNVNLDKIFLIGSGAGGCMALRLAFLCPEQIAGVVSINGELPQNSRLFARLKSARQVPVFLSHFRNSTTYLEYQACQDLALLHSGGFSVTLRQYPCENSGCRQVFRDINYWMMEQVTG